jgi:hypothetical protein
MLEKQIESARKHIIFVGLIHFIGGFGLAILLQYYLSGNAYFPVSVGWILVALTFIGHMYVMIR